MQNSIHTFQQLSEQHLSMANNRNQITQVLEKVKGRVLKVSFQKMLLGIVFSWDLSTVF